jgi:protoporphyrinogen oxidase
MYICKDMNINNERYDMIIVGTGPAGISLSHCCTNLNKKILMIDREPTIGGCHRVKRVNGDMFTEHSPRVYISNYVNFFHLISEIGIKKYDIFTDYYYNISNVFNKFKLYELSIFGLEYIKYLFNHQYGNTKSLLDFCKEYNFSIDGINILNKLCKYIDGCDITKYSVNKLLSSIDYSMSKILQPKRPLDVSLFNKWKDYLEKRNVEFLLGSEISEYHYDNTTNNIDYIMINNKKYYCDKLIFAIPPSNISKILQKTSDNKLKNAFGDFNQFREWCEKTEYNEYIAITYHFKDDLKLPKKHGMTFDTEWDIVCINLSEYMENIESKYRYVISVSITNVDKRSSYINKTANECTKEELEKETYRQIKASLYHNLPDDYTAIMNPNNYYNNKKWNSSDEAYFNTVNTKYIPSKSVSINNLYNVGTHNGNSYITYTTMESAVSNGITLALQLYPELHKKYYIRKGIFVSDIIYFIILIIIVYIILSNIMCNNNYKNRKR